MMNENEQENEKRETLADILAEMRGIADLATRFHNAEQAHIFATLSQRIEAAWEREREELDKRISDLEAYAKLWTGRADELRLKCDEFYAKAKPVGNAAAHEEKGSVTLTPNEIYAAKNFAEDVKRVYGEIASAGSAPFFQLAAVVFTATVWMRNVYGKEMPNG